MNNFRFIVFVSVFVATNIFGSEASSTVFSFSPTYITSPTASGGISHIVLAPSPVQQNSVQENMVVETCQRLDVLKKDLRKTSCQTCCLGSAVCLSSFCCPALVASVLRPIAVALCSYATVTMGIEAAVTCQKARIQKVRNAQTAKKSKS